VLEDKATVGDDDRRQRRRRRCHGNFRMASEVLQADYFSLFTFHFSRNRDQVYGIPAVPGSFPALPAVSLAPGVSQGRNCAAFLRIS
jgi:hypothetical protein